MKPSYYELFKTFTPPVINLDDPVLDPYFVTEAREFERLINECELTEEKFKREDRRLLDLFNDLHPVETEEPEDVQLLRKKASLYDQLIDSKPAIIIIIKGDFAKLVLRKRRSLLKFLKIS